MPPLPSFDPDFAGPAQWAAMYRACGLQVVPCRDKRPLLAGWREYQNELVPQTLFDSWYTPGGRYFGLDDMGVLTGPCSGSKIMMDLDTYKPGGKAAAWWQGVLEVHNNGLELETWEQRTGGGGRQMFFQCPAGWMLSNASTGHDVDIRGKGGFAVLPPTRHASGRAYEWLPGRAPWEVEILVIPDWLIEELEKLTGERGGPGPTDQTAQPAQPSQNPGSTFTAFGRRIDGREAYMADMIWAALVGYYIDSPIPAGQAELNATWADYLRNVEVQVPLPGETKEGGLERENRGWSEFDAKWRAALAKWHVEIAQAAATRPPKEQRKAAGIFSGAAQRPAAGLHLGPVPEAPKCMVLTAAEFVAGFTPPAYLIDGMLQRGYLYSLTARTGHGKTAVAMYIGQCVARGQDMHGRAVKSGTVLLLAGENPDDIRARYLVLAEAYGFVAEDLKMRFVAGVVNIEASMPAIRAAADAIPDLMLVMVDTAAAYFPGDETNSNSQQGAYARQLRQLTFLNGKPTVLVNCHPVKNAASDNLLPMGGSAFLNEVDGNLTLWSDGDKQVTLHWQGKFRGPEFNPSSFELAGAESARVVDAEGRLMPSVVAKPVSDLAVELSEGVLEADENRVLRIMHDDPRASFMVIANRAGFVIDGRAQKVRVQRIVERLKRDKLIAKHRGGKYRLTAKGRDEIGVAGDENE